MQIFLVPLRASQLGASAAQIGVILALGGFVQVVGALPTGAVIQRIGARRGYIAGCLVVVIVTAAYGLVDSIFFLGLLYMCFASARLLGWLSSQTYITSIGSSIDRLKHTALFSVSTGVVSTIGPMLVGFVAHTWSIRAGFAVISAAATVFLIVGIFLPTLTEEHEPTKPQSMRLGARTVLREKAVMFGLLISIIDLWAYSIWSGFFPLALVSAGASASQAGLVVSVKNAVGILPTVVLARANRWQFDRQKLGIALVAMCLTGLFASGFATTLPLAFLVATMIGVGGSVITPVSLALVGESQHRALALSFRSLTNQLSATFGPLTMSLVIVVGAASFAFPITALIAGAIFTGIHRANRK